MVDKPFLRQKSHWLDSSPHLGRTRIRSRLSFFEKLNFEQYLLQRFVPLGSNLRIEKVQERRIEAVASKISCNLGSTGIKTHAAGPLQKGRPQWLRKHSGNRLPQTWEHSPADHIDWQSAYESQHLRLQPPNPKGL